MIPSVLYICLSDAWTLKERAVIRDCLIVREAGYLPILYCRKKSFLEKKAQELELPVIHYTRHLTLNPLTWYRFFSLSNELKALNVCLVHSYDLETLLPISIVLRRLPFIPLICTLYADALRRPYVWHHLLASRIDLILYPWDQDNRLIASELELPLRKIDFCGLGVKWTDPKDSDLTDRVVKVAISLDRDTKMANEQLTQLWIILEAIMPPTKYCLYLVGSKFDLSACPVNVCLVDDEKMLLEQDFDLWCCMRASERADDYILSAILSGRPVILPRTSNLVFLLQENSFLGESYKLNDFRELRCKLQKMIGNIESYRQVLKKLQSKLCDEHGHDAYKRALLAHYLRVLGKRKRRFQRGASQHGASVS